MSWLGDKRQDVKKILAPAIKTGGEVIDLISSFGASISDPIQVDTDARKANEDFLASKGIVFEGALGDVTDFMKSIPGIHAVTQTPMEKVETYSQRISSEYETFRDNVDTLQALVNQGKIGYDQGVEAIKREVARLQSSSDLLSKDIGLTKQPLKIPDIEQLIDIGINTKKNKEAAVIESGDRLVKAKMALGGGDPEKEISSLEDIQAEFYKEIQPDVQKLATDMSNGNRAYNGAVFNGDYVLNNTIQKLVVDMAEKINTVGMIERRAQEVIDLAKEAGEDTTEAEKQKQEISSLKQNMKDNSLKFMKYYINNIGTEGNQTEQDFYESYKKKTGNSIDELLGLKQPGQMTQYETQAQLIADKIDSRYRPFTGTILGKGGVLSQLEAPLSVIGGRIDKNIAERGTELIGSVANKLTGGENLSDPFTRTDNSQMKNFLFAFDETQEPSFLTQFGRILQQVGPEVTAFIGETLIGEKIVKVLTGGLGKIVTGGLKGVVKAMEGMGFLDEYYDLKRGQKSIATVIEGLSKIPSTATDIERNVALRNIVRTIPKDFNAITQDVIAGTLNAFVQGPVISGLIGKNVPEGYTQGQGVLDLAFMGGMTLLDTIKTFKKYSSVFELSKIIDNPKFLEQYYKNITGIDDVRRDSYGPKFQDFATNVLAKNHVNWVIDSAKKIDALKPGLYDNAVQIMKTADNEAKGKQLTTIVRDRNERVMNYIVPKKGEGLTVREIERQKARASMTPAPEKITAYENTAKVKGKVGYTVNSKGKKGFGIHNDGLTPVYTGNYGTDTLIDKYRHTKNRKEYFPKEYGMTFEERKAAVAAMPDGLEKTQANKELGRASYYIDSEADTINSLLARKINPEEYVFDVYTKAQIEKVMGQMGDDIAKAIFEINPNFDYIKITGTPYNDVIANIYMNTGDWIARFGQTPTETEFTKYLQAVDMLPENLFPGAVSRRKLEDTLLGLKANGHYKDRSNDEIVALVDRTPIYRVMFDGYVAMLGGERALNMLSGSRTDYIITNFIFNILDSGKKDMLPIVMGDNFDEIFYQLIKGDDFLRNTLFGLDNGILSQEDRIHLAASGLIDFKTSKQIRDNQVRTKLGLPITNPIVGYDATLNADAIMNKALYRRLLNEFPEYATLTKAQQNELEQELVRVVDMFISTKNNDEFLKVITTDSKISGKVKNQLIKKIIKEKEAMGIVETPKATVAGQEIEVAIKPTENVKIKGKSQLVREKNSLDKATEIKKPYPISFDETNVVPTTKMIVKQLATSSDKLLVAQASETNLLDTLLKRGDITPDQYRDILSRRNKILGSDKNTYNEIVQILKDKKYDGWIKNKKKSIFSQVDDIVQKESIKKEITRQIDDVDSVIKQYNETTKPALKDNFDTKLMIKDGVFQRVEDILPDDVKKYQKILNSLPSHYRVNGKTLLIALSETLDNPENLAALIDDIMSSRLPGGEATLDLSKAILGFFDEAAARTGKFGQVFTDAKGIIDEKFLKKFNEILKFNVPFLDLVKLSDWNFFRSFMDNEQTFNELFGQTAENFKKVRYAMQIVSGDDYISQTYTWVNRALNLAYKLPATYFSGVAMVTLNAIQMTTEKLFGLSTTWANSLVSDLRREFGIMCDERFVGAIGGGWAGNMHRTFIKGKYVFDNLLNNGAYDVAENMASGWFINKATAQALTEFKFQNVDEFRKYMSSVSKDIGDNMVQLINSRAMEIYEGRTANSFNRNRGRFVFGNLQKHVDPTVIPKGVPIFQRAQAGGYNSLIIPLETTTPERTTDYMGRFWNGLMNTYMFMGTWGTRHIINAYKLISSLKSGSKLYYQLVEEKGIIEANRLIKDFYNRNFDALLLVNKMASSMWAGSRLERMDTGDDSVITVGDVYEMGQMFYAPLQAVMSSPLGRAMYSFIHGVFLDKNHQDMDINNLDAGVSMLRKQIMNDLGRRFTLPRSVVGALSPGQEQNLFVATWNNLMDGTQGLMSMLSDEVTKKGFDFDVPRTNQSILLGIVPGMDDWKQKYFDEGTLMKLKMIEEGDAYSFKNWFIYSIPFIKDYQFGSISDYKYQELVNKLGNDPVYIKAIMEGKLPINGDPDYIKNIFSTMTQRNLSQSNTLFERGKNFEQKFLGGASFLNAKEKATTQMLLDYLSNGETEAFLDAFNSTDNTKAKQGLHLLAFVQSLEGGKMGSPGASSELIANIMQEQYYLWVNNFRKANPAYKYNKVTGIWPKIPDDVDTLFKAQLVADYSDLLYTVDKDKFADAMMFYIRKANPEYSGLFTEPKEGEEWKTVAFAKTTTQDVTYSDGTFVPKGTKVANYGANSVYKLDLFTKMQILNGDGDGYAMKNAFSTLYNPSSYQAKDPIYVSVALKSMNDNIRYIKESNMSEQDKTSMISGMMLGALPMIDELQKNEELQRQVGKEYNDTMYWLMGNVTDGIELATEIGYRKLQDGQFVKTPEKTGTVLDNYSATGNYYGNYYSSNYNSKYSSYNSIINSLKSYLQSHPNITTSKFAKPKAVEYQSYIDSEKKLLALTSGLYYVGELNVPKQPKFKREGIKLPSRSKSKGKGKGKGKGTTRVRKPKKFFAASSSK